MFETVQIHGGVTLDIDVCVVQVVNGCTSAFHIHLLRTDTYKENIRCSPFGNVKKDDVLLGNDDSKKVDNRKRGSQKMLDTKSEQK